MQYEKGGLQWNNSFLFNSHPLIWDKLLSNSCWLLQFDFCFSEIKWIAQLNVQTCTHSFLYLVERKDKLVNEKQYTYYIFKDLYIIYEENIQDNLFF